MAKRDNIFKASNSNDLPFSFNEEVTEVFEDMIDRSVPGYKSSLKLIENLGKNYYQNNSSCYDLGCSLGASTLSLLKAVEEKDGQIYAVDNKEEVIGTGRLHFNNEEEGQIRYMAVSESIQRKGLGSAIVSELELIAKKKGAREMVLNARKNAINFYLSLGYKEIELYESDTGIPHTTMRKELI